MIASAAASRRPCTRLSSPFRVRGSSLIVAVAGDPRQYEENIYVRPGDVITSTAVHNRLQPLAPRPHAVIGFDAGGITRRGLGQAGGLNDDRSDPYGVFVLRYEPASLAKKYPNVPERFLSKGVVPVRTGLICATQLRFSVARRFTMRDKDISTCRRADYGGREGFPLVQMAYVTVVTGGKVYNVASKAMVSGLPSRRS